MIVCDKNKAYEICINCIYCNCRFSGIDGALLAELAAMRVMSPDVYYDLMKSEYHMPLLHLLRLNLAIRKLICM